MSSINSERLVFVDECSTNTSLAPLYGWGRRGERVSWACNERTPLKENKKPRRGEVFWGEGRVVQAGYG